MPTFSTKPSSSLGTSIRNLVAGIGGPNPLQLMQMEGMGAETAQRSALAEKARMEVEEMRKAAKEREDPTARTRFVGSSAGLDDPTADLLEKHVSGAKVPALSAGGFTVTHDDEGNLMPDATYAQPANVTPQQRTLFDAARAAVYGNQLATGKTNAEQLSKAVGEGQGQRITAKVQEAIGNSNLTGVDLASSLNQGGKLGTQIERFKPNGGSGAVTNVSTGAVATNNPLAESTIEKNKRENNQVSVLRDAIKAAGGDPDSPAGQALFKELSTKLATHQPAASMKMTVENTGPKAFEQELGKMDAEQLGKWREGAQSAQQTLGIVQNLRDAAKSGVYSGGGAALKTQAANLINGLTGVTPTNLVGSQLFNAEASKLVLERIKTLGANPSNADREFIEKTVPNITTSPEARDQLIAFMEGKANQAIDLFQRADTHARARHGLGGFNPVQVAPRAPVAPGGRRQTSVIDQADAILGQH